VGSTPATNEYNTSAPRSPAPTLPDDAEPSPRPENTTKEAPEEEKKSTPEIIPAPEKQPELPKSEPKPFTEENIFDNIPEGAEQLKVLCARPGQDKVRQVFCSQNPPPVTSLVELQRALGLGIIDPNRLGRNNNGTGGNAAFVFTAGSSSLVSKFTSSINPRLIMFSPPTGNRDPDLVALGFVRGEQFAEIIAGDPSTNQLNFFLVRFEQACNKTETGCNHGELLTPAIESNWTNFTIYEDVDIQNTIADCKQCHQPGGENTPKMLRMQELRNPWTHFMRDNTNGGRVLIADYQAAHGTTETMAGIPGPMISSSDPALLENLVRDNGFANQPGEFPTRTIEGEVAQSSPGQPANNATLGTSQTWNTLYAQFVNGTVIAPPFHDVKVTDPAKLQVMTKAYQDFRNGVLPMDKLPDIRNTLPEAGLRDMGLMVKAGLTGSQILMNACAQCHNSNLPQNISRAKFNVDLTKMSKEEKELAIARLSLPESDPRRMPPARFRTLTKDEINLLTLELRK
jgi:mono/diheme cytochrome c family protein